MRLRAGAVEEAVVDDQVASAGPIRRMPLQEELTMQPEMTTCSQYRPAMESSPV